MKIINLETEANRCLQCKSPRCKQHCPISTEIPKIISLFKENKIDEAGEILFKNNPLSVACAIVCAHEDQCMGNCITGIKGEPVHFPPIERYVSQTFIEKPFTGTILPNGKRVAIIGSGPAGITLAFILSEMGYRITIFEKHQKLGGVLRYGIPDFRLPKEILDHIEKRLLERGVKIRYNELIGPVTTVDKILDDGYKAIFIGTGVWNPKPLNIKGETLGHVNYAINYLKSPESYHLGKNVIIIGAGNVAMDAARTVKRNGSEVTVYYRRGFENMTATKAEIAEAIDDGVKFELYHAPEEILDEGIKFLKGLPDSSEKEEIFVPCDSVIIAISQIPKDNIISNTTAIKSASNGLILTDREGHTSKDGVFAAGDVVTGAKTVVEAVADAKLVAEAIHQYCSKED